MEKTLVRVSNTAKSGYEMVVIDNEGKETVTALEWCKSKDPKYSRLLQLPANPANRQWLQENVILKHDGQVELEYKMSRTLGERTKGTRKPLEDYLSDEDKATYLALVEKAKKNKEELTKKVPLTPIEKAKAKADRYLKQYEELLAKTQQEEQ